MKKYRILIIGAGHAGTDLHYPAYKAIEDVEVSGFCDINGEIIRAVSNRLGVKGFTDLNKALKEIHPHIISITTPPKTHYDIVKKVLRDGVAVILEKPIFSSVEEAQEIMNLEKARGGKTIPVHNKLSQNNTKEAIRLYKEGSLGKVLHVNAYWMVEGKKNEMTADPGHWSHNLTGGRWEELIPHPIYLAYQFMGRMQLEYVSLQKTEDCLPWLPGDEVVIVLGAQLGYVTIRLSMNKEGKAYNYFEVMGSKRSFNSSNPSGNLIMQNRTGQEGGRHGPFMRDVIHALNSGNELPVSWDEAINTLELTTAIGQEIGKQWNFQDMSNK